MTKTHRFTAKAMMAGVSVALAAAAFSATVNAMSLGHSRLLSPVGQPLRIQTPVTDLSAQDLDTLSVTLAPAAAWKQAGLVPPVDLTAMQVAVVDGVRPGSKVITISSTLPLSSGVADLLLVVKSASGQVQHQVSLLAPADLQVAAAAVAQANRSLGASAVGGAPVNAASGQVIQVRQGDTLWSLAQRHSVPGVSIYQWMVAVQIANPSAFIRDNVNLVKAGASLAIPDSAALTAMSDVQARRIFQQHSQAFAQYRQRLASQKGSAVSSGNASEGSVTASASANPVEKPRSGEDKVVLSSADSPPGHRPGQDDTLALQKNTQEAQQRLADLEDNVRHLGQALKDQGAAASGTADATGASTSGQQPAGSGARKVTPSDTLAQTGTPSGSSGGTGAATSSRSAPDAGTSSAPLSGLAVASSGSPSTRSPDAGPSTDVAPVASAPQSAASATSDLSSSKSSSFVSWFQNNLWLCLGAVLVVVVLLVVWLLRRSAKASDSNGGNTEQMVRERLQGINLDLDEPPRGGSGPAR